MDLDKLINQKHLALAAVIVSDYSSDRPIKLDKLSDEDAKKQDADHGWFYIEGSFNVSCVEKEGDEYKEHIEAQNMALDNVYTTNITMHVPLLSVIDKELRATGIIETSNQTKKAHYDYLNRGETTFKEIFDAFIRGEAVGDLPAVGSAGTMTIVPYVQFLTKEVGGITYFKLDKVFIVTIKMGDEVIGQTCIPVK